MQAKTLTREGFVYTFIPIQSYISLQLAKLLVLFIATWLLQIGDLFNRIIARRFCNILFSNDCFIAGQAVYCLCCYVASFCWQRWYFRDDNIYEPTCTLSYLLSSARSLITPLTYCLHYRFFLCSLYCSHNQFLPAHAH